MTQEAMITLKHGPHLMAVSEHYARLHLKDVPCYCAERLQCLFPELDENGRLLQEELRAVQWGVRIRSIWQQFTQLIWLVLNIWLTCMGTDRQFAQLFRI